METNNKENVELGFLSLDDYEELKEIMLVSYEAMPEAYWQKEQIATLINKFHEGQIAIKVNGELAGCAFSIIVKYEEFANHHTYKEITGDYTFNTHSQDGNILYGIDVFVKPKFRGMRLGRRLYDYRKELCENLNLKGIAFGGRIPNYHKYENELSPKEYIEQVKRKEIHDPVLNFQMSNDFSPIKGFKRVYRLRRVCCFTGMG